MSHLKIALKIFLVLSLLTGLIYPLSLTLLSNVFLSDLAKGSLIIDDQGIAGSRLIAQKNTGNGYFWARPSSINYNPLAPSGGSNLGPISTVLYNLIQERKKSMGEDAPAELLYASGSGLDPHISLEAAYYQIPRVAKNRSMSEEDLRKIIDNLKEGKQWGFIGPYYVNVLLLNRTLDGR